jgi:predicted S18 family serine protease
MNKRIILYYLIALFIVLLGFLLILLYSSERFNFLYSNEYSVYIPAVLNQSNNLSGEITQFFLRISPGFGRVYASIPPVFYDNYNLVYLFAKDAACNIYPDKCNYYDYYFSSNDVLFAEGFSGTAGLTLLVLQALSNKTVIVNYPITGFMLPNGIIAPVEGIEYKLNATLQYFPYMVAPYYNNSKIIPAYTILDLERIYFGEQFNNTYNVPKDYIDVMKNITNEICSGIDNSTVNYYISLGNYYTAASLCFEQKVTNPQFYPKITKEELEKDIADFYNYINNYECFGNYECEEIKYQVILRLEEANKTLNNLQESYWRYYSAIGWAQFLSITNNIYKENKCSLIDQQYTLMQYLYLYQLPSNLSCFEKRNYLSNLYFFYVSNSTNYVSNDTIKSIEQLDYYYYNRYGFSITSYNYLQFGKDLINMGNINSGLYYLILSIEYAI